MYDNYYFLRVFSLTKNRFSTQKHVFHFYSHSPNELCVSFLLLNEAFFIQLLSLRSVFCIPSVAFFNCVVCRCCFCQGFRFFFIRNFFTVLRFLLKKIKNYHKHFMYTCFYPDFVVIFCKLPIIESVQLNSVVDLLENR